MKKINKISFGLVLLLKNKLELPSILFFCGLLLISCHKKHEINIIEWDAKIIMYNNIQANAYAEATGCRTPGGDPFEYEIDISTSGNKQCGYAYDQTKISSGAIFDYNSGQKINPIEVNAGTKLACRCYGTNPPLTGETQWYKRNNTTEFKATLFFTHSYQKDTNGNIIGLDPFIPTTSGDTFYCLRSVCGKAYKGDAYILRIK